MTVWLAQWQRKLQLQLPLTPNDFAQLTTDLQTAKSAFEAFKAASSAKASAETALENFIASGPIYGDGAQPSLTAEQTFVGQQVVLEAALKQADDSLHDTVTQGIDSAIQTLDTYLGNNSIFNTLPKS